jgi:hypothetical protein
MEYRMLSQRFQKHRFQSLDEKYMPVWANEFEYRLCTGHVFGEIFRRQGFSEVRNLVKWTLLMRAVLRSNNFTCSELLVGR